MFWLVVDLILCSWIDWKLHFGLFLPTFLLPGLVCQLLLRGFQWDSISLYLDCFPSFCCPVGTLWHEHPQPMCLFRMESGHLGISTSCRMFCLNGVLGSRAKREERPALRRRPPGRSLQVQPHHPGLVPGDARLKFRETCRKQVPH